MSRDEDERSLERVVVDGLRGWLGRVQDAVMAPWRSGKLPPDAHAVSAVPFQPTVDTILTEIGKIAMAAWSRATDVPPVSRHAFVMAALAQTENLLTRMPDEVYHLVFAELTDSVNAGETTEQAASRVESLLTWSGTYWPGRARLIAVTETTRAYGAGTVAAGMEQSRVTGRLLRKTWRSEHDRNVRASHREANGQTMDLGQPFNVGGYPLMYPGDPSGPADEVCGCRCDVTIENEA